MICAVKKVLLPDDLVGKNCFQVLQVRHHLLSDFAAAAAAVG